MYHSQVGLQRRNFSLLFSLQEHFNPTIHAVTKWHELRTFMTWPYAVSPPPFFLLLLLFGIPYLTKPIFGNANNVASSIQIILDFPRTKLFAHKLRFFSFKMYERWRGSLLSANGFRNPALLSTRPFSQKKSFSSLSSLYSLRRQIRLPRVPKYLHFPLFVMISLWRFRGTHCIRWIGSLFFPRPALPHSEREVGLKFQSWS